MSTIVFVHAHPDDEASQTSGSMTLASRRGDRVVVVYATNGDHGESPADLAAGESLIQRRRAEAEASARVTGAARVAWLGYADSGMTGWDQNEDEGNFHTADLDEAAGRLAAVLDEEDADVVVGYDWHGGYGHPDHVKVHHVTHRAAELAARRPRLLEVSMHRAQVTDFFTRAMELGIIPGIEAGEMPTDDGNPLGTPAAELHWDVDVTGAVTAKRAALACHASQTTDIGMFLSIPEDLFAEAFGHEYYIEPGRAPGLVAGWPFEA